MLGKGFFGQATKVLADVFPAELLNKSLNDATTKKQANSEITEVVNLL